MSKIKSSGKSETPFPEHSFLLSCLKLGISVEDIKLLKWTDCMKLILVSLEIMKNDIPKATQSDIDKLFR